MQSWRSNKQSYLQAWCNIFIPLRTNAQNVGQTKQAMEVLDEIRRAKPEDRLIKDEEDVINLFAYIIE